MVFCNSEKDIIKHEESCHNPYFNRWFSAIQKIPNTEYTNPVTILILIDGFLQYRYEADIVITNEGHNPYFNRWFSAINHIKWLIENE